MTTVKDFAESSKGFTKSPLGIIALFIVLVYGFATLAVCFGSNLKEHIEPLIWFLVIFPVLVFGGFLWLVAKHSDKIFGPSDFKNEDNFLIFLKNKLSTTASLSAASAKHTDNTSDEKAKQKNLDSIVDMVFSTKQIERSAHWKNRILWVDDQPENNIYERNAFESMGIEVSIALSTNEALCLLEDNKYAAIISDMGRKEGAQEGYVLLDSVRNSGNKTPFFIYAGSNLLEHKLMAKNRGAQGSTNQAQELYQMVMRELGNI